MPFLDESGKPVELTPEEQAQYFQQAGQQQPSQAPPGSLIDDQGKPVDPFHDLSAEDLASLVKQAPDKFDLISQFQARPELQKDPAMVDKVANAFHQIREQPIDWKDLAKHAPENIGNVISGLARYGVKVTGGALKQLASLGIAATPAPGAEEAAATAQQESRQELGEAAASAEQGMTGLVSGAVKTAAALGRGLHLTKPLKDFSQADKVNALFDALATSKQAQATAAGQGPIAQAITGGYVPVRPEETAKLTDPFSWEALGLGTRAAGAVASKVPLPNVPLPSAAQVGGGLITGAAEGGKLAAGGIQKLAPAAGVVSGAMAGAHVVPIPIVGHVIGAIEGATRGAEFAKKVLTPVTKGLEQAADFGRRVSSGEVTGAYDALVRDTLEATPKAAGALATGVGFDLSQVAGADTPQEREAAVGLGTAFGLLGAANAVGRHVISGQIIGPRAFDISQTVKGSGNFPALEAEHNKAFEALSPGQKARMNAVRLFTDRANPNADVFVLDPNNPTATADALVKSGMSPEQADFFSQQNGFATTLKGRKVIGVMEPGAAPHEAFHGIEDVLGEGILRQIDPEMKAQYANQWENFGKYYASRLVGHEVGSDWRDVILDKSGWGDSHAVEKAYAQTADQFAREAQQNGTPPPLEEEVKNAVRATGVDWRTDLSPEEKNAIADRFISRELLAENFDAWFKHAGPTLEPGKQMPERVARIIGDTMRFFGANPLAGRTSEGLGVPLTPEAINDVRILGAAAAGTAPAPTVEAIAARAPTIAPVAGPAPSAVADKARKLAQDQPDIALPGQNQTQREVAGAAAEAFATDTGLHLQYSTAPEEPAASLSLNMKRADRRSLIEAFRQMPDSARKLFGKLFFPKKFVQTKASGLQIQGWSPEVFAANAHRWGKFIADLSKTNPDEAIRLAKYETDDNGLTETGWKDLYDDLQNFVANQRAGKTGAGESLVVPKRVTEAGYFAPPTVGKAGEAVPQDKADLINMLFGFRLPGGEGKPARAGGGATKLPQNIAGRLVSEATQPGRVSIPVEPREPFGGGAAERQGVAGEPVMEVNPYRSELEAAAKAAGVQAPSMIESWQNLNLNRIKEATPAPEQPKFGANPLTLQAGFMPAEKPEEKGPVWYSQASRVIDSKMPAAASGEQVAAILRNPQNGVKADELKWTGLDDYLKGKQRVTKQEVQDYLKQNAVQVNEVERGGENPDVEAWWNDEGGANEETPWNELTLREKNLARQRFQEEVGQYEERGYGTKFEQYQLPGGENYRELLFTLPSALGSLEERGYTFEQRPNGDVEVYNGGRYLESYPSMDAAKRAYDKVGSESGHDFKSSHWDEPNVLAHVRFNERTDADGKKMLFLEEIQSDWHQKGRKEGYTTADQGAQQAAYNKYVAEGMPEFEAMQRAQEEFKSGPVPDAPFKTSWHEMVFRRMVRWAAEHGFEKLGWTTGEQQAERYDLSKHIDTIAYNREGNKLRAYKKPDFDPVISKDGVRPEQLADYIGKEAAEKLLATTPRKDAAGTTHVLEGEDLKVGGEGMKGFYDKILVDYANKFGKKFAARVEDTSISQHHDASTSELQMSRPKAIQVLDGGGEIYGVFKGVAGEHQISSYQDLLALEKEFDSPIRGWYLGDNQPATAVHSLPITPEMRKSAVEQGVAQFQPKTFIVRHGSTEMNSPDPEKDLIRGHIDVPLDAKGRREATETAKQIAEAGGVQHIITSDLGRTVDTAKAIQAANPGSTVTEDPGLRPWNFGPTIEGKPTADMLPKIADLTENPDKRPPGGETFNEFKDRFLEAFHRAQDTTRDANSAIVTHYRGTKLLDAWRKTGVDNDTIDKAVFEQYDKDKKPGNVDVVDKTGAQFEPQQAAQPFSEAEDKLKYGVDRDEPLTVSIPLSKISIGQKSYDTALRDNRTGAGSRTEGEPLLHYDARTGKVVVEDGMHRIAAAANSGKKEITAQIHSGPSDYTAYEPYAQFSPSERRTKTDWILKEGPGLFSKAWIAPDGKPIQLGNEWHHEWVNNNPDVAKKYGLKPTTSGEENRVDALKKGFARINYEKNTGTLKVEARAQDWPKIKDSVREMVKQNLSKIDNMDVHLLDKGAKKIVDQDGVALHTYDAGEKMDQLPFISAPSGTTTMSAQAPADLIGGQYLPAPEPRALRSAAVRDPETGQIFEAPIHAMAVQQALGLDTYKGMGEAAYHSFEHGFTTNEGEFLNRAEAAARAAEMKQLMAGRNVAESPSFQQKGGIGVEHLSMDTLRQMNENRKKELASFVSQLQPADSAGVTNRKDIAEARKAWAEKGTDSPFFKKWFGDSKVVDSDGQPTVVYHGTTHKFSAFGTDRGNPENSLGVGHYFTTDESDASGNYGTVTGPDLQNRIASVIDRLVSEGIGMRKARDIAHKELVGSTERVIPAYLKLENPVVLDRNGNTSTRFDYQYDEDTGQETGSAIDLYNSLLSVARDHGVDGQKIWNDITQNGADDLNAYDVWKGIKDSEEAMYGNDPEGRLMGSEIARQVFQDMGFDGIELTHPAEEFPGMSIEPSTKHFVAFNAEQVKGVQNRGTFSQQDPRYQFQPSRQYAEKIAPEPTEFKKASTLKAALQSPNWAIITANQEKLGPATADANVTANENLEKALIADGYNPVPVKGSYNGVDQGKNFLVTGMTPEEAQKWGNQYGQESVLTPHGYLYGDGTVTPVDHSKTVIGPDAEKEPGWSKVEGGPSFSLGLDFNKRIPLSEAAGQEEMRGTIPAAVPPKASKSRVRSPEEGNKLSLETVSNEPDMAKYAKTVADRMTGMIPGLENISTAKPIEALKEISNRLQQNIKYLYGRATESNRQQWRRWYDIAREMSDRWGKEFGLHGDIVAAINARLSPQTDWYNNVTLTRAVLETMKSNPTFTAEDRKFLKGKFKNIKSKKERNSQMAELDAIKDGQKLSELNDTQAGFLLRSHNELFNDLPTHDHDLEPAGGNTGWSKPFDDLRSVVSIYRNPSRENVNRELGNNHKVRSFYNNHVAPDSPNWTTIDTHAVAAATLFPFGGSDQPVKDNFGNPKHKSSGYNGTYFVFQDAYEKAAKDLGILPRELQSIVWEQIRQELTPEAKRRLQKTPELIKAIHEKIDSKELTPEAGRDAIMDAFKEADAAGKRKQKPVPEHVDPWQIEPRELDKQPTLL